MQARRFGHQTALKFHRNSCDSCRTPSKNFIGYLLPRISQETVKFFYRKQL